VTSAQPAGSIYLVYGENGARLLYSGEDVEAQRAVCERLAVQAAGYVAGYQFVGRQRYELRCYLDTPPSERFMALRSRRELFDFGWHPAHERGRNGADSIGGAGE